ncbi:MAG TPA: chemotaxis protein CheW [Anaeromyxobacteraceae bacterium]|nr:chemotaxis protein CheW [Anaeromyxobacteraceae bacterium]
MSPTKSGPDVTRAGAGPAKGRAAADPLDDFFYSKGESAPGIPRLEGSPSPGASALPQRRREFVAFRLGDEEYAFAIEQVREIFKAPVLTEVPRAPDHVAGIVLVRGEVVAVHDPYRRLGLTGSPGPAARVIVCHVGQERVGLLVDGVSEVLRLLPSEIEERAQGISSIDAEYIVGVGRQGQRLVVLLDVEALVAEADEPAEGRSA